MLMGTDQYTVDEMEVHEIPTPKPTRTHHPVPHGVFASEVEKVIAHNGFSINRKEYAIFRDGMRMLGIFSIDEATGRDYQLLWMEDQPELSETFNQQKILLVVTAHRFAQLKQEREVPFETTAQEVEDIAQIYRERADRNRALTGDYFAGDPLVERDGATCRAMVQMIAN